MQLFRKGTKQNTLRGSRGSFTVIIAAAGGGTRLGGIPKGLLSLSGHPMIEYSLELFGSLPCVENIVISSRGEDIEKYQKIVADKGYTKVSQVVCGGMTRQESVSLAFRAAFSGKITDFVAIHDAARPLIAKEDIEAVFSDAKEYGCSVFASPCPDTVKRVGKSGFLSESVDREGLCLIGTPQAFSYDIYATSLALCERDGISVTDDSSMAEYAGFKIKLTEAKFPNFKVTYPEDIVLAESYLRLKKEKNYD